MYLLAAGSVVAGGAAWALRQPFAGRWALAELDRLSREETGLPFRASALDLDLLGGRVVLRDASWGGDLLRIGEVEVQLDTLSLLGSEPRIHAMRLANPRIVLDQDLLKGLRLKSRPKRDAMVRVQIGPVSVQGGSLALGPKAWGLPPARFAFLVDGHGLGENRLQGRLSLSDIEVPRLPKGQGYLDFDVSDKKVELRLLRLGLGKGQVESHATLDLASTALEGEASVQADLQECSAWAGAGGASGKIRARVVAKGTLDRPELDLEGHGTDLGHRDLPLRPLRLHLKGKADPDALRVSSLDLESEEGRLRLEGDWRKGSGIQARVQGTGLALSPLATAFRSKPLEGVQVDLEGALRWPQGAGPPRLDAIVLTGRASFSRQEQPAGQADLVWEGGSLRLASLSLRLPGVALQGNGEARLGPTGVNSLRAEGSIQTQASEVSQALFAWGIGEQAGRPGRLRPFEMAGAVEAKAAVTWNPAAGLSLDGQGTVAQPRWHGARADRVQSDVRIRGTRIWVENTEVRKGEGWGRGNLWVDWGSLPPGSDALDLCYTADRLPVAEGLRAADLGDLPIEGTGSGWVRIHGELDRLHLEGEGLLSGGRVYGMTVPSARAGIELDLAGNRLRIPEFRIAESPALLGFGETPPEGALALRGSLDMDLKEESWIGEVSGSLDSAVLSLGGPRFQAFVQGRLEGPWTRPFGPADLPQGRLGFQGGRIFIGSQSLEGLNGTFTLDSGLLQGAVGMAGRSQPFLALAGVSLPGRRMEGTVGFLVAPESADTPHLAARLSRDLLQDARADVQARGVWDAKGFQWEGMLRSFSGHFQGFDLLQSQPGRLEGDGASAKVDLHFESSPRERPPVNPGDPVAGPRNAPAKLHLAGLVPFTGAAPMSLRAEGGADLRDLKTILDHLLELENASGLLADFKPEGQARLDVTAGGTYQEPRLDGELELSNGSFRLRSLKLPQGIEDVTFKLRFQGREILIPEKEPLLGYFAQGSLGVWGSARWQLGGLESYSFRGRLQDFQLRDLPHGAELRGTLQASLEGTDQGGGILRGTLDAERASYKTEISIRDLVLGGVSSGPELGGLDPEDPLARIDLDLDLNLHQPWDLDTNLIKLQGRPEGSFKVLGTLARPGLKGRMDLLPGGRLTNLLPSGDVVLERGSITFTDPLVTNPLLALEGRIDVPPYLVTLAINGTVDQLNLVPSSTPNLRQDEIIAILIDPTVAQSIGAAGGGGSQTALTYGIANASSGLLSTLAFANFQETLRKTLQLDRVSASVRTGTTGNLETSVTLGKSPELFGSRTPIIATYRRSGEQVTLSGQAEWRFGNFVLQLGVSSPFTRGSGVDPTGEIRYTWSPK
ncbi:MAG: translocation/assembly module TamB domain-containing protein [Acidobacteria bacterium]|nr:translocation/assembly module TamB domain-containing protein [Acidobacteriota bacterium]